jgi:glucose-1-phosphate cytidylyltransferase
MKTVILCGGLGTRLREETEYRPKPMVEIGGRPILWHIMKHYAYFGFHDFILCLGYKGAIIKEYFLNYEAMNNDFTVCLGRNSSLSINSVHREQEFQVTLADTGADTLTGGRVARIEKYVDGDTFMVTYGDGLSNLNISDLVKFHRSHGKLATVTSVRPVSRFGVLELDSQGRVLQFSEKPTVDSWVNAGFFVFDRRVFNYLSGDDCILEHDPLQRLAADGQLLAFPHEGYFQAMDTFREYQELNALWRSNKALWKVWDESSLLV